MWKSFKLWGNYLGMLLIKKFHSWPRQRSDEVFICPSLFHNFMRHVVFSCWVLCCYYSYGRPGKHICLSAFAGQLGVFSMPSFLWSLCHFLSFTLWHICYVMQCCTVFLAFNSVAIKSLLFLFQLNWLMCLKPAPSYFSFLSCKYWT